MTITYPEEDQRLTRQSSIYQHAGMLSVRKGDEWVPIAFDVFDGYNCGETLSHQAVLTLRPYIGYHFPVAECPYVHDTYLASDQQGEETALLPSYFGSGFYQRKFDREVLVNSASGALGVRDQGKLRVGLDYVVAKHSMTPVD